MGQHILNSDYAKLGCTLLNLRDQPTRCFENDDLISRHLSTYLSFSSQNETPLSLKLLQNPLSLLFSETNAAYPNKGGDHVVSTYHRPIVST